MRGSHFGHTCRNLWCKTLQVNDHKWVRLGLKVEKMFTMAFKCLTNDRAEQEAIKVPMVLISICPVQPSNWGCQWAECNIEFVLCCTLEMCLTPVCSHTYMGWLSVCRTGRAPPGYQISNSCNWQLPFAFSLSQSTDISAISISILLQFSTVVLIWLELMIAMNPLHHYIRCMSDDKWQPT